MKSKSLLFVFVSTLFLLSCSKSSEDAITDPDPNTGGGNNNCDTTDISYQSDIVPILTSNCYACHGQNSNASGMGIILEGHANLKARADNGTLLGVITHATGFPAMPKDGAKLSDCNINKIRAWIENDAPDN